MSNDTPTKTIKQRKRETKTMTCIGYAPRVFGMN